MMLERFHPAFLQVMIPSDIRICLWVERLKPRKESANLRSAQAVYIVRAGSSAAAEAWGTMGTGPNRSSLFGNGQPTSAKPIWRC